MSNFRLINRDMDFLMPPSVDEWLPQRHLARFVVEVIEGLDLRAMTGSYRGSGEASSHPRLLLGLIIYGYAIGVFSSRNLGGYTTDFGSVPLHRRQRASRPRHHRHIPPPLPRTDRGAVRAGARRGPRDGRRSRHRGADGTRLANASRHSALSHEHASRIEAQLKAEVADLLGKAEAADQAEVPGGMQVPEELSAGEAAGRDRPRQGGDRGTGEGAPCRASGPRSG